MIIEMYIREEVHVNQEYYSCYNQSPTREELGQQQERNQQQELNYQQKELEAQIQRELEILDKSYKYTSFIIIAILLQQGIIREQKCQLLTGDTTPLNLFPTRLVSNLLVLCALAYFKDLAEETAQSQAANCQARRSNRLNCIASNLVFYASLIRLIDLLCGGGDTGL